MGFLEPSHVLKTTKGAKASSEMRLRTVLKSAELLTCSILSWIGISLQPEYYSYKCAYFMKKHTSNALKSKDGLCLPITSFFHFVIPTFFCGWGKASTPVSLRQRMESMHQERGGRHREASITLFCILGAFVRGWKEVI